ncbi:MAG: type II toxin-antitoxin system VapC family toxin [Aeromicrobium sp.]|nr:type II toxin-antitoxin system VapC family toxin [Burkholderiales bacterium]
MRYRKGGLKRDVAKLATETLERRAQSHFVMLPVSNKAAALAAEWLRNPLQTNDALHLAIAHAGGATTLATFDERFAKAAQKLRLHNLKIELIRPAPPWVAQKRAAYLVGAAPKPGPKKKVKP